MFANNTISNQIRTDDKIQINYEKNLQQIPLSFQNSNATKQIE